MALPIVALASLAAPAAATTPAWNGYHWARTGPLTIGIGNNVSTAWSPFLSTVATQWSAANNIDFVVTAGKTAASTCKAVYGGVQACSYNYGATGWLGYASVWLSGGHIIQATVKLNDYYFASAKYNNAGFRQFVTCQEVGHTLGLGHANTSFSNLNVGTCMDYTNDPTGTKGTNGTLSNLAPSFDDFTTLNGIYNHLDGSQLTSTKPNYFIGMGFGVDGEDIHEFAVVPEPTSWAMLIAGFGLVGAAMRRRRAPRVAAC